MRTLSEFTCLSCHRVDAPVTTPCALNFCISCLPYQSSNSEARVLRSRKNSMKCPSCTLRKFMIFCLSHRRIQN
ncbi:putative transcription factor C2H2 family [Helianthus annuus]|nr:putative transcription factor C2H2 family [Helianthus annuus]